MGGPGGSSGAPRRFSGHGFNRAWASDSIAQSFRLLISQPFHSVFSYMDSNGDPLGSLSALGGAWGALGGSRRFSGYGFNRALAFDSIAQGLFLLISQPFYNFSVYNRQRGTWGFVGGSGSVTGVPGRPSGVPWPQAVLRDSRDVFVIEVQNQRSMGRQRPNKWD